MKKFEVGMRLVNPYTTVEVYAETAEEAIEKAIEKMYASAGYYEWEYDDSVCEVES